LRRLKPLFVPPVLNEAIEDWTSLRQLGYEESRIIPSFTEWHEARATFHWLGDAVNMNRTSRRLLHGLAFAVIRRLEPAFWDETGQGKDRLQSHNKKETEWTLSRRQMPHVSKCTPKRGKMRPHYNKIKIL
jgi:hypothetical protein